MKSSIDRQAAYRAIPSVQELLQSKDFAGFALHPRYLKAIIQQEITAFRKTPAGEATAPEAVAEKLRGKIRNRLERLFAGRLRRVINATGILLHTNLGRAPLAEAARRELQACTENYASLEIDLATGRRGNRSDLVEDLLCMITGSEAALLVNNCAAAVVLTLNSLSAGKEVPVSRGELVEIGGSFRMPDVMAAGGAKMVEIGTTNKTHLSDYRRAVNAQTGALLKVHTSNYRIMGFSHSVALEELVALAAEHQLPLIYDLGSGVLEDLSARGFSGEPVVRDILNAGAGVVMFSGDKILGGPQAGIIAGKRELIERIRQNHLLRALRCDKLIYAAMAATLKLYLQPDRLPETLPVMAMMALSPDELRSRAERIRRSLQKTGLSATIVEADARMGSGALPLERIPSVAVRLTLAGVSADALAGKLRDNDPPIIGYVQDDAVLLNMRTVREDEIEPIVAAFNRP